MGTKLDRLWSRQTAARHRSRRCLFIACAALAVVAGGCGSSGGTTDAEKAADVEVLNDALAQELTTVAAYKQGLALLHGQRSPSPASSVARTRLTSTR